MSANDLPWRIERIENYQGLPHLVGAAIVNDAVMIAEVRGAIEIDGQRWAPNADLADLIVAAPDLLVALQRLWPSNLGGVPDHLSDDFIFPCDITAGELRAAQAAIAKAGQRKHGSEQSRHSPDAPAAETPQPQAG